MTLVSLHSRIPEIMATLPERLEGAALTLAEEMAASARDQAKAQYAGEDPFSIEAKAVPRGGAVMAAWYYFFGEFGTTNQPARPFMVPAFERTRPLVTPIVHRWLTSL